ncbi:hypothetical protein [Kitasatospora sp. NPDC058218]|uniref:hypothetical protein n=1 Tax=Kitasatospora sp. NPDC058218 TaxID=3346385 RepID=UPI0036DF6DCA
MNGRGAADGFGAADRTRSAAAAGVVVSVMGAAGASALAGMRTQEIGVVLGLAGAVAVLLARELALRPLATAGVVAAVMGETGALALSGLQTRAIGAVLGVGGAVAVLLVRELRRTRRPNR